MLKLMDMKRLMNKLFLLLAVAGIGLFAAGCSDEDENGEDISSGDIVGTWKWDSFNIEETELFGEQYIQFSSDGQYIEVDIYADWVEEEIEVTRGVWKQSENKITVSGGDDIVTTTMKIDRLTETDLTLVVLGISMSYTRVPDAEIEKYLE